MPLSYLSATPSGADMNTFWAEMDRGMGLTLDGLNPWMKVSRVGAGDTGTGGTTWASLGSEVPAGRIFAFTGGTPVRLRDVADYNHSTFRNGADDATIVSSDALTKTAVVSAIINLDASLQVHTQPVGGVPFWLIPDQIDGQSNIRALRRHRYAVAEILVEGLSTLTIPRIWDRYECFRVANFSGQVLTLTIEMPGAGASKTLTVPKYGCRSFRRTAEGYYDASLNYFWKFRNTRGRPRFWYADGTLPVEASAAANNLAAPVPLFFRWFVALGWRRDPTMVHSEAARFPGLFGDPSVASTPIGDLVHHFGAFWSVRLLSGSPPYTIQKGSFNGHSTLVSDLAAIGITATWSSTDKQWTLAMASDPGGTLGFDAFAPGTNLLVCPAVTYTVPVYDGGGAHTGDESHTTAAGLRLYRPLPVTLPGQVFVPGVWIPARGDSSDQSLTVSWRTGVDGDGQPTYDSTTITWSVENASVNGDTQGVTWHVRTRLDGLSAGVSLPSSSSLTWSTPFLTPQGWRVNATYSRRLVYGQDFNLYGRQDESGKPTDLGLYDALDDSGVLTIHSAAVITALQDVSGNYCPLDWPTDTRPAALYPNEQRHYGQLIWPGSPAGSTVLEPGDFTDLFSTLSGGDITPVSPREVIDRPDLKVLKALDAGTANSPRNEAYRVFGEADEGRSVIDSFASPLAVSTGITHNRLRFAAGLASVVPAFGPAWIHRKPLTADDFNLIAWSLNSVKRATPVYELGDFILDESGLTIPANELGITQAQLRPAKQWCQIQNPYHKDGGNGPTTVERIQALGITVKRSADLPGWTAAKAVYKGNEWRINPNESEVSHYYWSGVTATTRITTTPASISRIGASITPGSGLDNFDVDVFGYTTLDDYWWLDVDDVAAWAASNGLPCRHRAFGTGHKLVVRNTAVPSWMWSLTGVFDTNLAAWPSTVDSFGNQVPYTYPNTPPDFHTTDRWSPGEIRIPIQVIRFEPAQNAGETEWIATADSGLNDDLWFNRGAAWRKDLRQLVLLSPGIVNDFDSHALNGDVTSQPNAITGHLPTATRSVDAHEEQAIYCGWSLPAGTVNNSRLLLAPGPVVENQVDWLGDQTHFNLAYFQGAEPPQTAEAPDFGEIKSVLFTSSTNLFRADPSEYWNCQLWDQVFISLDS